MQLYDSPIERNGDGAEPRAETCTQRTTPNRIGGTSNAPDFVPDRSVQAMRVDQRGSRQDGHMGRTENSLGIMGGERSAEEDEECCQDRGSEHECQSEGKQSGLDEELALKLGIVSSEVVPVIGTRCTSSY